MWVISYSTDPCSGWVNVYANVNEIKSKELVEAKIPFKQFDSVLQAKPLPWGQINTNSCN